MPQESMLEKVINGQLPNEIAAMYDGYLITQAMQEHPLMATAPSVRPPNVVICDGEQYGVYDLTHLESVSELKEWLDGLDLDEDIESLSLKGGTEGVGIRASEYGSINPEQKGSKTADSEKEQEIAEALVRVEVLEEKKAKHLEEISALPEDDVKDISLRRLGETEYRLRQAKGKVNMLKTKYRHNMVE